MAALGGEATTAVNRDRELTEQIVVRFTPDQLAALKLNSEQHERTVSQTVRLALVQFLDRQAAS